MNFREAFSCGYFGALKLSIALVVALVRPAFRLGTAFVRHDFPVRHGR
jgi:hypothetical protein